MNWYFEALRKYAVFNGRAGREEYWMFILFHAVIIALLSLLAATADLAINPFTPYLYPFFLYFIGTLIPFIAISVRRLHDTDHSGWWLWITFLPIVDWIVIYFLILDSQDGENKFGPNPKTSPQAIPPSTKKELYDISGRTNYTQESALATPIQTEQSQQFSLMQRGSLYWTRMPNIRKKENPLAIIIILTVVLSTLYILSVTLVRELSHKQIPNPQSTIYPPLSANTLKNFTYNIFESDTVTLQDGKYERNVVINIEDDSRDQLYVGLVDYASGDLDGDGSDDAVVVLQINSGGSGIFYYLVPVFNEQGMPKIFNSGQELGDRIDLHKIYIQDGIVTTELTTQGPEDPLCCPTKFQSLLFHVEAKELRQSPLEVIKQEASLDETK